MKVETSRFYDNELDKICNVVWQVDGIPFYQKEIILPSGFVEVIFNLSAEVKYQYGKYEKFNLVPKFFINGINANRLSAYGVGPLSPVSTNQTDEGRKLNRRVELVAR